jgi:hypothetical protein
VPEGWIAEQAAALQLSLEELLHPVAGGKRDRPGIRLVRLNEDAAWSVAPTATRQLRHELEGAFLRPEVGQRHARVRVDDSRQGDPCEVVTFRDHLRAEEDGSLGGGEAVQPVGKLFGPRHSVGVEPEELQLREALRQLGLEALAAGPEAGELRRPARSA